MPSWLRNLILVVILLLILGWTCWPVALVMTAGSIAASNGCQLDEGSVHPCIVNGTDMGEQLYSMGVMGWFMLVTIPTGLLALATFGVILLIVWLVRRNRRPQVSPPVEATNAVNESTNAVNESTNGGSE